MKTKTTQRTIKTLCGKTLSFIETTGNPIKKAHSTEGPAVIYPESDNLPPEYYLYGIKYTKAKWKELINQSKVVANLDNSILD